MGEFKIQHHVSELIKLFGISEKASEGISSNTYAEILEKNWTPYVTTKVSSLSVAKKLADSSPCPEAVYEKYDDLKVRNFREVDSLAYLLTEIQGDEKVKSFLKIGLDKGGDESYPLTNGHISHKDKDVPEKVKQQVFESSFGKKQAKKKNVPPGILALSDWVRDRPNLSWDFVVDPRSDFIHSGPIGVLPLNVQESRLIDDILFCLVGVEGDYIFLKRKSHLESQKMFHVDESANISFQQMVNQISPLFSYYSTIISFVEEKFHYEQGLVNHALAAAMRIFLKDYYTLVSRLENQHLQNKLTLHKLWFYVQNVMTTMETLSSITASLQKGNCMGGDVLTLLHNRTVSWTGPTKAQDICHSLMRAASRPYFEILEKWIYQGIISDFYSEFLVKDNEPDLIQKEDSVIEYTDDLWDRRYSIRRDQIPIFLERAADMILRTGKYLNVIRQCGKSISCPNAKNIVYTMNETQYIECIEPAYNFASNTLFTLLMEEKDLKGRLRSVRHYFLLDEGDFIIQFMDMAEEELQKDIDDIMPTRLESLLELALRTSAVNEDKYKDDVRVELLSYSLITQMVKILQPSGAQYDSGAIEQTNLTGIEAFAFDYEVKWPLSLIINRKALACYQMLFRHLFFCKHVENVLGRAWAFNKRVKSLPPSELCLYAPAFALGQRMLNFVQTLDYYLTLEVIEPHWQSFYERISQVTNVDDVLICHVDFLERCLADCMLTNPLALNVLGVLLKLCIDFSNFLQGAMKSTYDYSTLSMNESLCTSIEQPITKITDFPAMLENFNLQISNYEKKFNAGILDLLSMLSSVVDRNKHPATVTNILYRLDFNGFYEEIKAEPIKEVNGEHNSIDAIKL